METFKHKPWKERKAWLIKPGYTVTGEEYAKVRPAIKHKKGFRPDLVIGYDQAAICFERQQCIKERGKFVDAPNGGFAVRTATRIPNCYFVVEGPPDEDGRLPDWGSLEHRKCVATDNPHVFELVEEGEE